MDIVLAILRGVYGVMEPLMSLPQNLYLINIMNISNTVKTIFVKVYVPCMEYGIGPTNLITCVDSRALN